MYARSIPTKWEGSRGRDVRGGLRMKSADVLKDKYLGELAPPWLHCTKLLGRVRHVRVPFKLLLKYSRTTSDISPELQENYRMLSQAIWRRMIDSLSRVSGQQTWDCNLCIKSNIANLDVAFNWVRRLRRGLQRCQFHELAEIIDAFLAHDFFFQLCRANHALSLSANTCTTKALDLTA